ncbi:Metallo-hydrolase/oxidoreductase [Glonium stellatum]|uniref:Metallo-hydrolase/oxidoreductase n=1 Tax=Glonium stellatum TaxID=574774 RepID=A0A8E2EWD6_9PEZI|nr:Metallo-hydrolase/oxidoreductase [Glonium stellatum]
MSSSKFLTTPKPAPELNIPESSSTVKISVIDSTARLSLPFSHFLTPTLKGKESIGGPAYSTLIEHPSGRKVLFDLGVRKDWENMAPIIVGTAKKAGWSIKVEKNVAEILEERGLRTEDIEAVIWSHHHFDHTGDVSTFPPTTALVVGPGFTSEMTPGYPTNPEAPILESDWAGRELREISFPSELRIGNFLAYDFFGDGSFYLLDTPGHAIGHMSALCRTTSTLSTKAKSDTFVFLGGDCCHHGGEFRPTPYLPLPSSFSPSPLTPHQPHSVCLGSLFTAIHPASSPTEPFFDIAPGLPHDIDEARRSIRGMEQFDAHENILVVIAHDESLLGLMEMFPKSLNAWSETELKERGKWAFLADFSEAVEQKKGTTV